MNIQKIKRKLVNDIGPREELTELDSKDYTNRHYDKVIVRNTLGYYIILTILPTLLLAYLLITMALSRSSLSVMIKNNWFWGSLMGLLLVTLIFYSVRQMFNRKPQIVINDLGIKVESEQLTWDEITETKFRILINEAMLFVVRTSTREVTIGMDGLNVGPRFLGHQIELLKKRYGKKHEAQQNV